MEGKAVLFKRFADLDVFEALFAGFDGEGLAFGLKGEPGFDAGFEAAFFGGEAG